MQILLNGEELDVQLENEKLLAEILRGVANWMESDSHYLKELVVDGVHYSAAEQQNGEWDFDFFQQELQQVGRLELSSAPMQAYKQAELEEAHREVISEQRNTILESLQTLSDYFQIARTAFESQQFIFLQDFFSDSSTLLELLERSIAQAEEYLWDKDAKTAIAAGPEAQQHYENPLLLELRAALELWAYFQNSKQNAAIAQSWKNSGFDESREQMLAILQDVLSLLAELREDYEACLQQNVQRPETLGRAVPAQGSQDHVELAQPGAYCDLTIAEIRSQLAKKSAELEKELGQLQNGQVQQSLYYVSELSLLLEQLLQQQEVQGNQKLNELFSLLGPFLQNLTGAIEDTDTVTIGDLVEYEIIPLIQQIIDELS